MTRFLSITAISIATLAAQSIHPPRVGFAATAGGALRPVDGVAGNFLLGPPVASQVISQAFSGSFGLLKTDSALTAFDHQGNILATTDAPPGPAMFAFLPNGVTALAYIPSTGTLIEWRGTVFATLPFRPANSAAEPVLAIALPNVHEASFLIQRSDGIWQVNLPLTRARGMSQKALPGVMAPILALPSGDLVYTAAQGIVLRHPDASEVLIPGQVPSKSSLDQMSSDWVLLSDSDSGRHYAIRLTPGREGFYQLPEAGQ